MNACIKRTWTKGISIESELAIDIWDSGSHKYERWPDGDVCWKVISRELTSTGFSEILEKMPEWFAPGQVLHWARVPLLLQGPSQYQLGQWSVAVESQMQAQAQAQAKPLPLPQAQGRPQAQAKPLAQVKPLQGPEKMGARGGRQQGPQGHMRHEGQMGAGVTAEVKLKVLPQKQPEQPVKVQILQRKPQLPQGHQPKSLPRLINQK